jgi:hypothetical protein
MLKNLNKFLTTQLVHNQMWQFLLGTITILVTSQK